MELATALWQSGTEKSFEKFIWQEYFNDVTTYDSVGCNMYTYTPDNIPADLNIMPNIPNSNLVIMEQQGVEGLMPTHEKFVDYVNQNLNRLFYRLNDNAITYTVDQPGVTFENFWMQENWGRWSQGKQCTIGLHGDYLASEGKKLTLQLSAESYGINRNAEILFNGHSYRDNSTNWHGFDSGIAGLHHSHPC